MISSPLVTILLSCPRNRQQASLAKEFGQSQSASEEFSKKVGEWSQRISQRQSAIEARLTQIEATQQRLSKNLEGLNAALAKQTASTTHLVQQVNALLSKSGN